VRIVQMANFVMPSSGGLRIALQALSDGYRRAGHDPVLIIPGDAWQDTSTDTHRLVTVPGVRVPGTGGYRVMLRRRRIAALLDQLQPDRLEVSDRFTLRWTAEWARSRGIPAVMVSHESLRGLLATSKLDSGLGRWLADRLNRATAAAYDCVVCTTRWASEEFERLGVGNLVRAPLGVDLDLFHPGRYDDIVRSRFAKPDQILLIHCGRLSYEKRPRRSIDALADLRAGGVDAVLVVAGDGPLRGSLVRHAADLPVHFLDHVSDRGDLAALLASSDAAIAPGPIETFGLAALEALACGTPVVVDEGSALPEVVGPAGVAVSGEGRAFAAGLRNVLALPEAQRRGQARQRAEEYGWDRSVARFLHLHGAPSAVRSQRSAAGGRLRFVALGDSTTAGMGDPMSDGSWRGWAALLAQSLAAPDRLEYHNLAEPGAQSHTLVERQLPPALSLRPNVATVIVGVNDTLRGSFDIRRVARSLERAVGDLCAAGAVVLTARLPDPGRLLSLPRYLARPLARRIWAVNEVMDALARRFSTVHLDASARTETHDPTIWSVDRLHLSECGHRMFAALFAELLAQRGFTVVTRPDLEPSQPAPSRWAQLSWLATRGTRWILHRSTDLVPTLVWLAIREWWCTLRGSVATLDERVRAEVQRCIQQLELSGAQATGSGVLALAEAVTPTGGHVSTP
jgi:alpha-1,6-mannosyltransferase